MARERGPCLVCSRMEPARSALRRFLARPHDVRGAHATAHVARGDGGNHDLRRPTGNARMAGSACLLYAGMEQEGSDTGSLSARVAPKLAW